MGNSSTFIIADNQDITRTGMRLYIEDACLNPNIKDVTDKKTLISELKECDGKAVVVIDYTLFDINSIDELLVVAGRFRDSYWLLFSNELSESLIRRLAVETNIGMVLKESSAEEIRLSLLYAIRGERFLCHHIMNLLLTAQPQNKEKPVLTATETEILKLIAHGKSVKEIAAIRISSIHTIITHKKNIFRKIGVNNVYEATKYSLKAGLVDMIDYYI